MYDGDPPLGGVGTSCTTSRKYMMFGLGLGQKKKKMQSETKPFIFPKAKVATGGFSGEERLGWRQFGWGGIGYWGGDS